MKQYAILSKDHFYRIFEHTADLGLEIFGKDRNDLFRNSVLAISDIIIDRGSVRDIESRAFDAEGNNIEELLINFLREILYLYNGERWLIKKCKIFDMNDLKLRASLKGEALDPGRHSIKMEIKAVTYHGVEIQKLSNGWSGRFICDV